MSLGLGVLLLVLGAILTFALEIEIPGVDDNILGWILMAAGLLSIILSLVLTRRRTRTVETRVATPTTQSVRRDDVL